MGEYQEGQSMLSRPRYSKKEEMDEGKENIVWEGKNELQRRLDQFMGCIAQQQTTIMAILDRLDHQRLSE